MSTRGALNRGRLSGAHRRKRHIVMQKPKALAVGRHTHQKALPIWSNGWSCSIVQPLPVLLATMGPLAKGSGTLLRAQMRDQVAPIDCASTSCSAIALEARGEPTLEIPLRSS